MTQPDSPPTQAPPKGNTRANSLILVNTGDGKGKSTAAFGTVMRARARDWPVAVVQFLKSGEWSVGEEKIAVELGVDWFAMGDGFTWNSKNMDESQAIAATAWHCAAELIEAGHHRLVVLDEVTYPMNWGWIDTDEIVATLKARPANVNVICTGRDAPAELIEIAHTVTEMRKIKHAYDQGIMARRGIDY